MFGTLRQIARLPKIATASLAVAAALLLLAVLLLVAFVGLLDESPDGFVRDLVIPPDLEMREPLDHWEAGTAISDHEGAEVLRSCAAGEAGAQSPTVEVGLTSLDGFTGARKEALIARLARDPAWHVGTEGGHRYAYRRFLSSEASEDPPSWQDSSNGFYGRECSYRIVLGFDGPVFVDPFVDGGKAKVVRTGAGGVDLPPASKDGWRGFVSYLVVESAGPVVEIYEDSQQRDRGVTRAALALVERELARSTEPAAPTFAVPIAGGEAAASIDLVNGKQGGIYLAYGRVNPGEPGELYLKAYEQTRNIPLSTARVKERSQRIAGSSADPRERFLYHAEFTIYEGDWGVYYPARIELWFEPASGKAERKLAEDVFRVQGWMR